MAGFGGGVKVEGSAVKVKKRFTRFLDDLSTSMTCAYAFLKTNASKKNTETNIKRTISDLLEYL